MPRSLVGSHHVIFASPTDEDVRIDNWLGDSCIRIITWIERTYHRRRRQARLGRLTPIEYETIMNPAVSLAA